MAGLGRVLKGISLYTLFMLVIHTVLVHDIDIIEVFKLRRGNGIETHETWHRTNDRTNDRSYYYLRSFERSAIVSTNDRAIVFKSTSDLKHELQVHIVRRKHDPSDRS